MLPFFGDVSDVTLKSVCQQFLDPTSAPTFTPVGLSPAERASLCWTHNGRYRALAVTGLGRQPPVTFLQAVVRNVKC
jgi:hypothetical protein